MKQEFWGRINYETAYRRQQACVDDVIQHKMESLIFCSHDPVVTLGKKSLQSDVKDWGGTVFRIERGGRATYHGPGQIVVYPIINLGFRNKDIHLYLRNLEGSVIDTLRYFGVDAQRREGLTGVWVKERKMASIGVAVRRWVTFHGLALNLYRDSQAFHGISPCGLSSDDMVSLEEAKGEQIHREDVEKIMSFHLLNRLSI